MTKCKVVYGPQGCGKTTNSEALMRKLGCSRAVDIDEAGDLALLGSDVLVLTNQPMEDALSYEAVLSSDPDAVKQINYSQLKPYSIEFGPKDRRFLSPALVFESVISHRVRGFSVPISAYLYQISVCLHSGMPSDKLLRQRMVRNTVESTLRIKFNGGQRGFRQWFLKHHPLTPREAISCHDFGKDNRRKIKEPTIHLNPGVEVAIGNVYGYITGISKRNGFRVKAERSLARYDLCV